MYKWLASYVRFVLSYKWVFVVIVGLITLLSAMSLTRMIFATSIEGLFFGPEHPQFKRYQERVAQFGSDELMIVAIEEAEPFSPANLNRLRAVRSRLKAMPDIKRLISLDDISRVRSVDGTIRVEQFADEIIKAPERRAQIEALLRNDPSIAGRLLSKGGEHFIALVELTPSKGRSAEQGPELIRTIVASFVEEGFARERMHLAGTITGMAEIVHQSQLNLARLLPAVLVLLLIAVYLMFGRWWPVLVNTLAALFAVLWAMGFAIWQDPQFSIMLTLVPCFILIISFSDVVHICSAYLLELDSGQDKLDAIVAACADVGEACLLTSLTTAVGFFSMMLIPSPVFERLGFVAGLGVAIAYFLALTVVPIALLFIPTPKIAWDEGKTGAIQRLMDRLLDQLAHISMRYRWPIIGVFAGMFAFLAWGATQIYFETEFNKRLAEDNAVRVDERFIQAHFDNPKLFDLYIEVEQPSGLLKAQTFERLVALEAELEARDDVDNVVGIVDLMRTTHVAIVGDDVELPFVPTDDERLAQTMELLQLQGVDALAPWIDFGRRTTRLTIYTNKAGIRAQNELATLIAKRAEAIMGPGTKAEALGIEPLLGSWVDNIVDGQKRGVLVSMSIIALLLVLGFGSVRVGLVSMIPNVLPLLALGGLVGLMWDRVDTDTLIIAMIAIGIGVDDTIHFISRYKLELKRSKDSSEAILRTFRFSGRGILITTFIFTVGFLPMTLSAYSSIAIMGSLLPYTFVAAVIADLLLVPAMISAGILSFGEQVKPAPADGAAKDQA